jgi:A/G-specific adenine glycosylase
LAANPHAPDEAQVAQALLAWFEVHARVLPWRSAPTPYGVWVSEIMLQQTRVATALPYYERWMARFPTLQALADAPTEAVLEQWAGLGYYRRARLLHEAARVVAGELGGELPSSVEGLLALPGVGRYTAGAIASIAHNLPAPIVDGNVIRVLCRIFGLEGDPRAEPLQGRLWALAERLIPEGEARDFNQSMMELGALVCLPTGAECGRCPVAQVCVARATDRVGALPQLVAKKAPRPVAVATALLRREDPTRYLLVQRPSEGLFGGLWESPTAPLGDDSDGPPDSAQVAQALEAQLARWGLEVRWEGGLLPSVTHQLTHLTMTFFPLRGVLVRERLALGAPPMRWLPADQALQQPLASAMQKVLRGALAQGNLF